MAYYLIQQDIYDLWDNLSEHSWLEVYDVLEYERDLLQMDEPLVRMLLKLVYDLRKREARFPANAQELYDIFSAQVNQYAAY